MAEILMRLSKMPACPPGHLVHQRAPVLGFASTPRSGLRKRCNGQWAKLGARGDWWDLVTWLLVRNLVRVCVWKLPCVPKYVSTQIVIRELCRVRTASPEHELFRENPEASLLLLGSFVRS